jgi:hypothetical protein
VSQAEIKESLLTSTGFYSLFQTLPLEIRQGFLQLLFQNNSAELEQGFEGCFCNYNFSGKYFDVDGCFIPKYQSD